MINKKVYIILINVGNWEDTIECINSIFKNKYINYQLIIVENSKDEISLKKITDYLQGEYIPTNTKNNNFYKIESNNVDNILYQRIEIDNKSLNYSYYHKAYNNYLEYPVIVIRNKKTSGFSENNNIGIKYALLKNDFEYIWILNNDTVIDCNALSALVDEIEKDKKIGIVGSVLKHYNRDNIIQLIGGGKFYRNIGITRSFLKNKNEDIINGLCKEEILKKIDMISGASFFFRMEVIKSVGMMDIDYFLYGEDLDYSYRMIKAGWKKSVALNSIVFHKHNTLTKKKSLQFYFFHNSRSSALFARKHLNKLIQIITNLAWFANTFKKTRNISVLISSLRGIKDAYQTELTKSK